MISMTTLFLLIFLKGDQKAVKIFKTDKTIDIQPVRPLRYMVKYKVRKMAKGLLFVKLSIIVIVQCH